jgi:DNA polymerase/3'-5' exonuclease PolX
MEVGGSLRRGKSEVKDAELIVIPKGDLSNRIHTWVGQGVWHWAEYGEDPLKPKTRRTGPKYFGLDFDGFKVEIFTATPDNWGYIYWLRTGAGDANQYLMQWLQWKNCPYHAKDGFWWEGSRKIATPSEADFYMLLGLKYLHPSQRTLENTKSMLKNHSGQWGKPTYLPESQLCLF